MKKLAIILIPGILLTFSCNTTQEKKPPAILEGKKVDVSSLLKQRGRDAVDALYDELVNNSEELQELEKQFKTLQENSADSMEVFKLFNDKNSSYYSSADSKISSIGDSSLRRKIRSLVNKSRYNYVDSVAVWYSMDSLLLSKTTTLNDLHTLLKLVKTLPLIEEFQKTHALPRIPPQGIVKDYDSLKTRLDSLTFIPPPPTPPPPVKK